MAVQFPFGPCSSPSWLLIHGGTSGSEAPVSEWVSECPLCASSSRCVSSSARNQPWAGGVETPCTSAGELDGNARVGRLHNVRLQSLAFLWSYQLCTQSQCWDKIQKLLCFKLTRVTCSLKEKIFLPHPQDVFSMRAICLRFSLQMIGTQLK